MHISTARDMFHNTRQAAKSAYDVIVSPERKTHFKAWRVLLGLASAEQTDNENSNSSDRDAGQK